MHLLKFFNKSETLTFFTGFVITVNPRLKRWDDEPVVCHARERSTSCHAVERSIGFVMLTKEASERHG